MPTSAFYKFQDFVEQFAKGVHVFGTHTFKVYLTNAAVVNTMTLKSEAAEITVQNGYTPAGGVTCGLTCSETPAGTATVVAVDTVSWTATTGSFGPFRYAVIYNDDATSPLDALVCYFDYGAGGVTVNASEQFVVDFGASLFTLT